MKKSFLIFITLFMFVCATAQQEVPKTKEQEKASKAAAETEFQNKKADEALEKQKAKRKEMKEKAAVKQKEATGK